MGCEFEEYNLRCGEQVNLIKIIWWGLFKILIAGPPPDFLTVTLWGLGPLDLFFFSPSISFIYLFICLFIYLFILATLGLRCCTRAFFSCGVWGLLFVAVHGLLIAVASHVEHGLLVHGLQ